MAWSPERNCGWLPNTETLEEAAPAVGELLVLNLRWGGAKFHVHMEGPSSLPALVVIHGAWGNMRDWLASNFYTEAVASGRYRLVVFDRPGHGYSDVPNAQASLQPRDQAQLIWDALELLGVNVPFVLLGHCWGALVAVELAASNPESVSMLFVCSPAQFHGAGDACCCRALGLCCCCVGCPTALRRCLRQPCVHGCGLCCLNMWAQRSFSPVDVPPDYKTRASSFLFLRDSTLEANLQELCAPKSILYEGNEGSDHWPSTQASAASQHWMPRAMPRAVVLSGEMDRVSPVPQASAVRDLLEISGCGPVPFDIIPGASHHSIFWSHGQELFARVDRLARQEHVVALPAVQQRM